MKNKKMENPKWFVYLCINQIFTISTNADVIIKYVLGLSVNVLVIEVNILNPGLFPRSQFISDNIAGKEGLFKKELI